MLYGCYKGSRLIWIPSWVLLDVLRYHWTRYSSVCSVDSQWRKEIKEINQTFIVLIPKQANPETPHHYRSIILCNVSYKSIAKVLANRLKLVINDLISPHQLTFIADRSIEDNILITHEMLYHMRTHHCKSQFMAIKMDLSKAYDRVEWCFLS